MCHRHEIIGDRIFALQGCGFVLKRRFPLWECWMVVDLFAPVTLDFVPMTFIYEPDPYSLEIYQICKYELPTSKMIESVCV